MSEPQNSSNWKESLGLYNNLFGLVGGIAAMAWFFSWLGGQSHSLLLILSSVSLTLLCVFMIVRALVLNSQPIESIGNLLPEESESLKKPRTLNNAEHTEIVEGLNETIRKLEGEKTSLEESKEASARTVEQFKKEAGRSQQLAETHSVRATMNQGLLDQLKTKYQWLHDEAERDKSHISKYVYIIFQKVRYEGLDAIEPYIEVYFNIINASVYDIIVDQDIQSGAVYFNDKELNPKQAKLDGNLHSISRGENKERVLIIKQWVSTELAERLKNPLPNDKLYFNRLWLNVRVANNTEIDPQRLALPSEVTVDTPDKLKRDVTSLKTELEKLKESELSVEISTSFDSSILLILNKETQPFERDEYIIKAYLKVRFRNPDKYKTTIENITLSLCTRGESGEVTEIQPNRFDLDIYPDSPQGAKSSGLYRIDFDAGLPIEGGTLTPYYWLWHHLEISRNRVSTIGSNHILRLTIKTMRQHPVFVDIKVDWESARNNSVYILSADFGSTYILLPESRLNT